MSNLLQEILEEAYFKMGEETTSSIFDYDGNMLEEANRIQREICQGRVKNILTDRTYIAGTLTFMQKKYAFEIVPSVALGADCEADDSTMTIDTTNFASAGKIIVNDDIITYTGKTSTTITGVSNLDVRHFANDRVRQLYQLPSDCFKPIGLYYDGQPIEYKERNDEKPFPRVYREIVKDNESVYEFINVVGLEGTRDNVVLKYLADATDMVNGGSACMLPLDFGVTVISNLLAGKRLLDTEEPEKGVRFLTAGYANLDKLYKDYAERVKTFRKKVRTSPITYLT